MIQAVHAGGNEPLVQLRRLYRFFGKTAAVHDVSFEIDRGQVYGFIGPNGAGKTTTMRILATLELPTYGDARVGGWSCIIDPDQVRKCLGFMPDGFGTYGNMNCVEYLDFFARAYGLVGRERTAAIRHTLGFTGLDAIAAKSIRGLSKGMRQRLCLGRAMIHNPDVLILDEPANGLDPRARIELRRMVTALQAENKAILVSSHILTELGEMCDVIGVIERGKLLVTGSVDSIRQQQQQKTRVEFQVLGDANAAGSFLRTNEHARDVVVKDNKVSCVFAGDERQRAALLRSLVEHDVSITEFHSERVSLEDVFMKITTGAVQ